MKRLALLLPLIALASSCAKQGMPSGGPRDTEPPRVLASRPPSTTTGFAGAEFCIDFDEYFVLKDIESNLIVSPPMSPKPEVRAKGRSMVVRLRDSLRANTTYSFQFLGAVADFNEGNLLPSLEYVFATGQNVDSMMIKGRVKDALTLKAVEDPLAVLLCDDTMGVRYQTRSLKDGSFLFSHIADGRYKLLALKDENKNLRLDTAEACAWIDTLVEAQPIATDSTVSSRQSTLLLSAPEREKQRLLSSEFLTRESLRIVAKKPLQSPCLQSDSLLLWQLGTKRDTLAAYLMHPADSMTVILSDPSGLQDTLRLRYRRPARPQPAPKVKMNFAGTMPYFDTLRFLFPKPVGQLDTLLHYLSSDSTEQGYAPCLPIQPLQNNSQLSTLNPQLTTTLSADWRPTPGKQYTIRLMGEDTSSFQLQITKPEDYGNINLSVPTTPLLYQLLNEKDEIVLSTLNSQLSTLNFPHLKPGKYRIRAIEDLDGNGLWTTGDYFLGRQPERVVYFPKTLEVRANWDMEEVWEL